MKWVTLAQLLYDGTAIGTLATAIEQQGIWGWDRYGRFKHFEATSDECKEALDLLAQQSSFMGDPAQELSPLDEADLQTRSPYDDFGWQESEVPDFKAIDAAQPQHPPPARPHSIQKSANAQLVIIGALLEYIEGKWNHGQRHPGFTNQAGLIQDLCLFGKGLLGLSQRNLEDKFASAKKVLRDQREALSH